MPVELRCLPLSLCSWDYRVDGLPTGPAKLEYNTFGEGGRILYQSGGTVVLAVAKPHLFTGRWFLGRDGATIAEARKTDALSRRFELRTKTELFLLRPEAMLGRAFLMLHAGTPVGRIAPHHAFTRRADCRFAEELDPPIALFAFWLAALMWRRQARAANS